MSKKKSLEQVWTDVPIYDGKTVTHKVGPVTIHIKKFLNEIWIAYTSNVTENIPEAVDFTKRPNKDNVSPETFENDTPQVSAGSKPSELMWNRWAMKTEVSSIRFRPIFPDRSVVIKPEYPFKIAHGASVRVYTRIPVFIRITPTDEPDHVITDIPAMKITGTWFGDFLNGELCYWITSKARREITEDLYEHHLCITPMTITNESNEDLPFDKMSLKVAHLSIYNNNQAMWADETKITYFGGDKLSDIEMQGVAPIEAGNAKLLTKPRTPIRKSLTVRTFRLIKEIPNFGLLNI